jgi:hypothetical protein
MQASEWLKWFETLVECILESILKVQGPKHDCAEMVASRKFNFAFVSLKTNQLV